jgi:hypothetical protein
VTPDELEALSRKYSNDVWHFIELSSGRWAFFNEARELVAVLEAPLFSLVKDIYHQRTPVPNPPELALEERRPKLSIDLSKLGL